MSGSVLLVVLYLVSWITLFVLFVPLSTLPLWRCSLVSSKLHIEVSREASLTIQKWIKEVNLHTSQGRHVTLPKACSIIIEDFSDVLRKDSEAMTAVMGDEDFADTLKNNEEVIEDG